MKKLILIAAFTFVGIIAVSAQTQTQKPAEGSKTETIPAQPANTPAAAGSATPATPATTTTTQAEPVTAEPFATTAEEARTKSKSKDVPKEERKSKRKEKSK
jgi:hypothetical protein